LFILIAERKIFYSGTIEISQFVSGKESQTRVSTIARRARLEILGFANTGIFRIERKSSEPLIT
jgi:hypothetical protein